MDVSEVTALVAGGGSGLGEATARHLAGKGADVLVVDRDVDAAAAVAQAIGGTPLGLDIADASAVESLIEAAATGLHKPFRLAVNCAGVGTAARILPRDGSLTIDSFRKAVEVNQIGTYTVMSVVARHMTGLDPLAPDGERGLIVNTASVAFEDGQIGQVAYASSKGGIASMTLPAARELARFGIRVVAIAPGLFDTRMTEGLPDDVRADIVSNIPFPKRLGHAGEYAALVESVAANVMLNGVVLRLDGAVRLPPK